MMSEELQQFEKNGCDATLTLQKGICYDFCCGTPYYGCSKWSTAVKHNWNKMEELLLPQGQR